MSDALADTHTIVWYLSDLSKLSAPALAALQAAEATGQIFVSTITFVELTYLVEKGKIDSVVLAELWKAVSDPNEPIDVLPLSLDVARELDQVPRGTVPDMPDRIIAATALAHGLPLVSKDGNIRSLTLPGLSVVW